MLIKGKNKFVNLFFRLKKIFLFYNIKFFYLKNS